MLIYAGVFWKHKDAPIYQDQELINIYERLPKSVKQNIKPILAAAHNSLNQDLNHKAREVLNKYGEVYPVKPDNAKYEKAFELADRELATAEELLKMKREFE